MKLRNKKTGEIGKNEGEDIEAKRFCIRSERTGEVYVYDSLKKLNEEWEDYEEPKAYYFIDFDGDITKCTPPFCDEIDEERKQIGNYFETKEEAEKAVEKLKAWKRLKDKGLKFVGWEDTNNDVNDILFELPYMEWDKNVSDDLDSLFGGEK